MGLSKHEDAGISIRKELELLNEEPVLLNGRSMKASGCYRISGNPPHVIYNTNCPDDLKKKIEAILLKYHVSSSDINYFYRVEFDLEDQHYKGRLTPEFKKGYELPASWHVVLNEVFFGHLHKNNGNWEIAEQRPPDLVRKIGSLIDTKDFHFAEA